MRSKTFLVAILALVIIVLAGVLAWNPSQPSIKSDFQDRFEESFVATLTRDQEVGMIGTSTAGVLGATSTATVNLVKGGQSLQYEVKSFGLSSAVTGAHLHCAPIGENGPVIVPLALGTTSSSSTSTQAFSAIFSGTIVQDDILPIAETCTPNIQTVAHLLQAMREGQIYVNVHTANNPAGETRGQLMRSSDIVDIPLSPIAPIATSTPSVSTSTSSSAPATSSANNNSGSNSSSQNSISPSPRQQVGLPQTGVRQTNWDYVFAQPDSYYKIQGSSVRFMGTHFVPGERVTIQSEGTYVATVSADSSGSFTTSWVTVPYSLGTRTYTMTGESSRIAFPVRISIGSNSPWIVLNDYYAGAGSPLVITGHQFGANENVTVWFNGINLGTARTDAEGDFSLSSNVPSSGAGQWTVRAVGMTTNMSASQPFSQSR